MSGWKEQGEQREVGEQLEVVEAVDLYQWHSVAGLP